MFARSDLEVSGSGVRSAQCASLAPALISLRSMAKSLSFNSLSLAGSRLLLAWRANVWHFRHTADPRLRVSGHGSDKHPERPFVVAHSPHRPVCRIPSDSVCHKATIAGTHLVAVRSARSEEARCVRHQSRDHAQPEGAAVERKPWLMLGNLRRHRGDFRRSDVGRVASNYRGLPI